VAGVIVFSLKPHSDASVITVVLIDNAISGLQAQKPVTMTENVPIVPNALLVNVGDVTEVGIC
jgi:isopenicillin N synthase-like dioxygenase